MEINGKGRHVVVGPPWNRRIVKSRNAVTGEISKQHAQQGHQDDLRQPLQLVPQREEEVASRTPVVNSGTRAHSN